MFIKEDFYFSDSGDFVFDENTKDFLDTKRFQHQAVFQKIKTVLQSRKGDWRQQRQIGANLYSFLGEPNTAATGDAIKQIIRAELVNSQIAGINDIVIETFPLSDKEIAVFLLIQPTYGSGKLFLTMTYNMKDNLVIPRNF